MGSYLYDASLTPPAQVGLFPRLPNVVRVVNQAEFIAAQRRLGAVDTKAVLAQLSALIGERQQEFPPVLMCERESGGDVIFDFAETSTEDGYRVIEYSFYGYLG